MTQGNEFGETCHEYCRQLMLDRLLALKHERYAEEVAAGLHEKKKERNAASGRKQRQRRRMSGR